MSQLDRPLRDPLSIPLNDRAIELVAAEGDWFARSITSQAKFRADLEDLDQVSVTHVRAASRELAAPVRQTVDVMEGAYLLAGILAGVFWPFLVNELRDDHRSAGWLAFFAMGAGAGLLLTIILLGRIVVILTSSGPAIPKRPSDQ